MRSALKINQTSISNTILLHSARKVIQEFKQENIGLLVSKGLYLAFAVYPGISLRPMSDVDFLVKRMDLDKIYKILAGLGYREVSPKGQ